MVPFNYWVGNTPTQGFGVRQFGQLWWLQFSIERDSRGIPGLFMTQLQLKNTDAGSGRQLLAEGIEDMQIAYACDNNPDDGTLRDQANASNDPPANPPPQAPGSGAVGAGDEWFLNHAGDNTSLVQPSLNCNMPDAYRLTLVARALTVDTLLGTDQNPSTTPMDIEDHDVPQVADGFRRRLMTTTIFARN
jgi:hypothetical protein